ncbi:hypothetical protein INR49_015826 [Caranx melampygus]|nr:hypothetical protein INR49_015826 [Caranx melampygus]
MPGTGHRHMLDKTNDRVFRKQILNKMGLSLLEHIIEGSSFKAPVPSQAIKDTYHFRIYCTALLVM